MVMNIKTRVRRWCYSWCSGRAMMVARRTKNARSHRIIIFRPTFTALNSRNPYNFFPPVFFCVASPRPHLTPDFFSENIYHWNKCGVYSSIKKGKIRVSQHRTAVGGCRLADNEYHHRWHVACKHKKSQTGRAQYNDTTQKTAADDGDAGL